MDSIVGPSDNAVSGESEPIVIIRHEADDSDVRQSRPGEDENVVDVEDEKSDEEDGKSGDVVSPAERGDVIINVDEIDGDETVGVDEIRLSQPSAEATLGDSIPLRRSADTESVSMDAESLAVMIAENERVGIVRLGDEVPSGRAAPPPKPREYCVTISRLHD